MPLTTPPESIPEYGGDPEHFVHVLEHLFIPAVEAAGYEGVRPVMTGADLIQAEIIRNLEIADLVLCDISRHNPNVFFELGVRTSLDRPIALVRDSLTPQLPFDTGILNTYTYDADLSPWKLNDQVPSLTVHLRSSADRSDGKNPLWRYFGLTRRADPDTANGDPTQAKLDLVLSALESMRSAPQVSYGFGVRNSYTSNPYISNPYASTSAAPRTGLSGPTPDETLDAIGGDLAAELAGKGVRVLGFAISPPNEVIITVNRIVNSEPVLEIDAAAKARGVRVQLVTPVGGYNDE